jgi:hypothetical protein
MTSASEKLLSAYSGVILLQYTMTSYFFDHFAMYLDQKEGFVSTSLIFHSVIVNTDLPERLGWVQAL